MSRSLLLRSWTVLAAVAAVALPRRDGQRPGGLRRGAPDAFGPAARPRQPDGDTLRVKAAVAVP
jgi:hypothetical protein